MTIFFIGDTHFGHANILNFEPSRIALGTTIEEHDEELIRRWNSVVTKNDTVWHLGDFAWKKESYAIAKRLNGHKRLILGNHDHYSMDTYEDFTKVHGCVRVKEFGVLTHVPLHPACLERWGRNIHGHLHSHRIDDERYINVSCEQVNFTPIALEELPQ